MTYRPETELEARPFSGGVRFERPLARPLAADVLTELDWSLSRPAIDPSGRLVELLDAPVTEPNFMEPDLCAKKWFEPLPVLAPDATVAGIAELGSSGIELEGATYQPACDGFAPCWQYSPSLGRLRGHVVLTHAAQPRLAAFENYLLQLNSNIRFVRLGCRDDGIALQAVVPNDDRYWLAVVQDALIHVCELLRPQAAWWDQPRALVEDLFHQARL
jgi:hypothetical protein